MVWPTDKLLALDTETTGLQVYSPNVQPTVLSWWTHKDTGHVIRIADLGTKKKQDIPDKILQACRSVEWTKLFFNAKFDIPMLRKAGVVVRGPVIDVLVMAQMAVPKRQPHDKHDLKSLCRRLLKDPFLEEIALKKWLRRNPGMKMGRAPDHVLLPYALKDAQRTIDLFFYLRPFFDKYRQWPILQKEMDVMRVILSMEEEGMHVDLERTSSFLEASRDRAKKAKDKLCKLTGRTDLNPNSNNQIAALVYNGEVMPTRFTKKGKPQVNKLSLIESPSEIGSLVLEYRKFNKTVATYLTSFIALADRNGKLHPVINQNGARTGRISCARPNLTNVPRPTEDKELGNIRACFVAEPGYRLVFADYDQLEIRIQAHFTREDHVIESILEGLDLHDEACRRVLRKDPKDKASRYLAKKLNLASQYGMGPAKFTDTVLLDSDGKTIITVVESYSLLQTYKSEHPKLMQFFSAVEEEVALTGGVLNAFGRFMPVPKDAAYKGVNYKIQSSAADLVKDRMIRVARLLRGTKSKLVLQVHDELIFKIHQSDAGLIPRIKEVMEEHERFIVPLTVTMEWGKDWASKRKIAV